MKKVFAALMLIIAMVWFGGVAQAANWDTFVIRNAADGTSPEIKANNAYVPNATEFVIAKGGQKAGWGTDALDGRKVGDILALSIDRLDDTSRFAAGSGPAVAPYINIWITDGAGNYAVIANEPSDAEWAGAIKWDMTWEILKTKTVKVYENSDKSWLPNSGIGLTFEDLAGFAIQAPTVWGWSGQGPGAPRVLGSDKAYGFNWVFGDTLSNYVSGAEGYVVANPVASVPEPATLMLLGFGLIGVAVARRKG